MTGTPASEDVAFAVTSLGPASARLEAVAGGARVDFATLLGLWQGEPVFAARYAAALLGALPDAFFWEHPPLTDETLDQPYACVVTASPALGRLGADPSAFAVPFGDPHAPGAVAFDNLGGDARLIAPRPGPEGGRFASLRPFLAAARPEDLHDLFALTAREVLRRIGQHPLWLSTSGLGVPWLHVRLDPWPKYYVHAPYRHAGRAEG